MQKSPMLDTWMIFLAAHTSNASKPTIKNIFTDNRFFLPVGVKRGSDVLIVAGIRIGGGWDGGTGGRGPTTAQRQVLNGEGAAGRGGNLLVQPFLVLKNKQGIFILKNAGELKRNRSAILRYRT
jgi:hypothetical protein